MKIDIETESTTYANIRISSPSVLKRYWVERRGNRWSLWHNDQGAFASPLKTWRETDRRAKVVDVLPEVLAWVIGNEGLSREES